MLLHKQKNMKDIIKRIHVLRSVHASEALRQRIQRTALELPVIERHWYLPFAFIQAATVAFALILFVMLGSGVVLADKLSSQGQPLYSIRQTIENLPVSFIHKHETPTPIPTKFPTPTVSPRTTKVPEKGQLRENYKYTGIGETLHKAVQGIFDFRGNHPVWHQSNTHKSENKSQHNEDKK